MNLGPRPADATSLVVGLGEVGQPLLEVLSRAHTVVGIDLPPRDVPERVDIMHVCYPAEIDDFVDVTVQYAERYGPTVIVIHSTVPVGTTRAVSERTARPTVHSPVRGKHARMTEELVRYAKFVGTEDDEAWSWVSDHFEAAGMNVQRFPTPETSELAKLAETTYFALLIAFAQDVDRMADSVGVDYEQIPDYFDEIDYLPPVRFFPGFIGGHCLMPNIELLNRTFSSQLLDAIEWSNELRKRAREAAVGQTAASHPSSSPSEE